MYFKITGLEKKQFMGGVLLSRLRTKQNIEVELKMK